MKLLDLIPFVSHKMPENPPEDDELKRQREKNTRKIREKEKKLDALIEDLRMSIHGHR